ncbi:MAG: Sensor histidine kinase RcsC [Phycisphaerae bacterium]|nr:Sensor histidine kinase RcsC [Phycisphaerae bacterium]
MSSAEQISGTAAAGAPASGDADAARLPEAVVAGAGVALIAADRDGVVRLWNPAAARMFGAEASAILGTRVENILPREIREVAGDALRSALSDRVATELEFRYPDERGRFRELAANVSALTGCGGETIGVLLSARDITRRFEAEQRLGEARKMSALGDLAGAVAHHLNNILGGITTTVDFALGAREAESYRVALERTAEQTARAARLMRSLLSFAEGDPQRGGRERIGDVLDQVMQALRRSAASAGVSLESSCGPLPGWEVPHSAVTTALLEIVKNAIEASIAGGRVEIRARSEDGGVRIDVLDTGRGLPASALGRIFEPFFRVDEATKGPSAEHAGLGLSIAYGIVRALGGSIDVASDENQGSCFTIRLPPTPT